MTNYIFNGLGFFLLIYFFIDIILKHNRFKLFLFFSYVREFLGTRTNPGYIINRLLVIWIHKFLIHKWLENLFLDDRVWDFRRTQIRFFILFWSILYIVFNFFILFFYFLFLFYMFYFSNFNLRSQTFLLILNWIILATRLAHFY